MMMRRLFSAIVLFSFIVVAAPYAAAQDQPTVAVLSLGSYDDLIENANVVGEIIGFPNAQEMLEGQIAGITAGKGLEGLDKTRPVVLAMRLDDSVMPYFITCVPVTDLQQLLGALPEQTGETEDVGDGVLQLVNSPDQMFLKEKDGWAFLAKEQGQLASIPEKPEALVGDLATTYILGVRGFVQNMTEDQRLQLLGFLEGMSEMRLAGAEARGQEVELQRQMFDRQMELATQWVNETDEITIGIGLDKETESAFLDFGFTATEGSKTAREYARFSLSASEHAGFQREDAAVSFTISAHGKRAEADLEVLNSQHEVARQRAIESIAGDGGVPDDVKQDVQTVLADVIDVAFDTLKAEKTEMGLALILNDRSSLVVGSYVSDGVKLESAIQKLVDVISEEDEIPPIEWGAENHGFYRIHVARIPVPDEAAQEFIGPQLEFAMAVNANSCYVGVGGNAIADIKKTIDAAMANKENEVLPLQMNVKVNDIMQSVAKQVPGGPVGMMIQATQEHGNVKMTTEPIEGGVRTRLVVQKGVIAGIAQAVMMGGAGAFGGGGDFEDGDFQDEDLDDEDLDDGVFE